MINVSKQQIRRDFVLVDYIRHDKNNSINVTKNEFNSIRKFVLDCVKDLPKYVRRRLILQYIHIFNKKLPENNEKFANIWLRDSVKPVRKIIDNCPFIDKQALKNDDLIRHYAIQNASIALNYIEHLPSVGDYKDNLFNCYDELIGLCREWNVAMPHLQRYKNDNISLDDKIYFAECALLRVSDEKWWERVLMRVKTQTNEHLLIAIGDVQKKRSPYISAQGLSDWRSQQASNREYLELMEVVQQVYDKKSGTFFESVSSLKEVADASSSNPKHRFTELMVRCRGLENIAIDDGFSSVFLTVTAPSKYHAVSKGQINQKWTGTTPKEAQAYLVKTWSKIRASLARSNINYYGVRVTEPHHDGTPHWHLLLFVDKSQESTLVNTVSRYALAVDGDEKGAEKHRFTVEYIDPNKGSATGYIAKYLSKNVNGEYIKNNKEKQQDSKDYDSGKDATEGAQRATAWASLWSLRQFQFFGAEPITVYRETRRLKSAVDIPEIEQLRQAVESEDSKGKWYAFTKAIQKNRVKIGYQENKVNRYNEKTKSIKGLLSESGGIQTRSNDVLLRKRGNALTWSPVNNCTSTNYGAFGGASLQKLEKMGFSSHEISLLSRGARISSGDGVIYQIKNNQLFDYRE